MISRFPFRYLFKIDIESLMNLRVEKKQWQTIDSTFKMTALIFCIMGFILITVISCYKFYNKKRYRDIGRNK